MDLSLSLKLSSGRLGGAPGPIDPDAPILDLDLWAGGGKGGWWHPGDPAVVFQDAAGTVPALNTNPVRRINDKSPNGVPWVAPSDGARGTLNISAQTSIKLDGVDDGYTVTTTLVAGMSAFIVLDRVTDASFVINYDTTTTAARFFGVAASSESNSYGVQAGTPTHRVNGVGIGPTRSNLLAALPQNTPCALTIENLDLPWVTFAMGNYASLEFGGRLFEYILCPNQTSTKRNALEQALAARHGITF